MPTSGFQLSALPTAPQFPGSVGEFDSARARKNAADQLELYKRLANLDSEQKATQARLTLQAKQDTAALPTVDPLAEEKIATAKAGTAGANLKSNVLRETGGNVVRSNVLASQADVGSQEAALGQQERMKALDDRLTSEAPAIRKRVADIANLADYDAQADALEQLRLDYPGMGDLPRYKAQAALLDEHIKTARQRALEQQKAGGAADRANIIATGGVDKAKIGADAGVKRAEIAAGGKPSEFERETNNFTKYTQLAAEAEDPDDRAMYEQRAALAKQRMGAINTPKAGAGSATAQKAQMGARHALDATNENTTRMTDLIDRIIPRVSRTGGAGVGSLLSVIPESDARALAADIDTLKANIGFNELNALRQASPTGGALGQVSERELHFLQNVIASLDTKLAPDVLRANLERAKTDIEASRKRVADAYERDFGGTNAGAPAASTASFTNEAEASAAAASGQIKSGDKITINGQSGTWH